MEVGAELAHYLVLEFLGQHVDLLVFYVLYYPLVYHCYLLQEALQDLLEVEHSRVESATEGLEDCTAIYASVEGTGVAVQDAEVVIGYQHLTDTVFVLFLNEVVYNRLPLHNTSNLSQQTLINLSRALT